MKFRSIIWIFILLGCTQIHSQGSSPSTQTITLGSGTNMRTSFNVGDIMSTKIGFNVADDPHIKGSPFYPESFSPSIIILKNGTGYTGVQTRMNLATNNVYFKTQDSAQLVAAKGIIKKLIIFQNMYSKSDSVIFSSGHPSIGNNDENTFYEELVSGKVDFLKLTTKVLNSVQSLGASPLDKQYVDITDYYVSFGRNGIIEKWRKGKDFIIGFLIDKKNDVQKFIEGNHLKCRSEDDIKKIFQYYNSLGYQIL